MTALDNLFAHAESQRQNTASIEGLDTFIEQNILYRGGVELERVDKFRMEIADQELKFLPILDTKRVQMKNRTLWNSV